MNPNYSEPTRIKEWWHPKAGNILAIVYLLMAITSLPFNQTLVYFIPSILTIIGIAGFGHFINDLFDIEADENSGKRNRVASLSVRRRIIFLTVLPVIAFAPWLILPFDGYSIGLIVLEFFLLLIYAIPPFRLKERTFGGVITDALYAYGLPSLLAAYTYFLIAGSKPDAIFLILLFLWQFFMGIHNILIHQLEDYENDKTSRLNTLAVKKGIPTTIRLKLVLGLIPELICFVLIAVWVSLSYLNFYFILPFFFLIFRYGFLLKKGRYLIIETMTTPFGHQSVNLHYHYFLPYWHLLYCVLISPWYLAVAIIHAFLFSSGFFNLVRRIGSITVNYGVYYFRRLVLGQDPKKARKEPYDDQLLWTLENSKNKEITSIAIINRNKAKFTETFVYQHLRHLPFRVHALYGENDYFPRFVLNRGDINALLSLWQDLSGKNPPFLSKWAFGNYLRQKNIAMVLAEFGTTGATVTPVCMDLGIPLVVIFYGYDASNRSILASHEEAYKIMFSYASKLIGVSKDICEKLVELGAPSEKVEYLPCPVNLELFKPVDRNADQKLFLSVGRFANMKSPHITILAFKKVLEKVPEACLIMAGNTDDGDLSETCSILVKSLGLEDKVKFRGMLTPEQVYQEMKNASVFVQHSVTTPFTNDKEGTPVAIMEAMACGMPVVATRHGGIKDIIRHGNTGMLVNEYDVDEMAACMEKLILDKSLCNTMGKAASDSIRSNPLISDHIKILTDLINQQIRTRSF